MVFLSKNKTIAGIIKPWMLSMQILKSLIASLHQTTLNGVLNLTPFLLGMIFIEMFMAFFPTYLIIKKLTNTNENTSGFFMFVFCSDIYRLNFLLLIPSVNTDGKISSVYTERITFGIEGIKKPNNAMTCKFLQT